MKGFIYGLVCPIECKVKYIGQTIKTIEYRKQNHIAKFKRDLKNDKKIRKSYKDCWFLKLHNLDKLKEIKVILLEECDIETLYDKEKYWIDKYYNEGYNLTNLKDYGYNSSGYKLGPMPEEYKIKISNGLKKFWEKYKNTQSDKERVEKIKNTKLKKYGTLYFKKSDEAQKICNLKLSVLFTGEGNPFYGKNHTDETKQKIKEKRVGKYMGEGNPFYGKNHTDETKQKIKEKRAQQIIISKTIGLYNIDHSIIKEYYNIQELINDLKLDIKLRTYYQRIQRQTIFDNKYLKYTT